MSSFAEANDLTTFHYRIGENDVWDDEVRKRVEEAMKVLLDERNYPSQSPYGSSLAREHELTLWMQLSYSPHLLQSRQGLCLPSVVSDQVATCP